MNSKMFRKTLLWSVIFVTMVTAIACRSKFEGTYSNANGSIVLEVKGGGKASLTFLGETKSCNYTTSSEQLRLECAGDETVFTRHDDESLTGPSGSLIGALKKSK